MPLDDGFERPFEDLEPPHWGTLRELSRANCEYFSSQQDENGLRITAANVAILDNIDKLRPLYKEIARIASKFDFDENTPGNGYRSFLYLVDKCILHAGEVCRQIYSQRDTMLFRKAHYMREIEAYSQLMASLGTFLHHLKTLYSWSGLADDEKMSLFPSEEHSAVELLKSSENIDQYCFYGRCLGFQFVDSLKYCLKTILVSMASFSEIYYTNNSLIGRCTNSLKYIVDPEARARRIVNISQRADVHFLKAFWLLNETNLVQFVPFMMLPTLSINQVISIPPEELSMTSLSGQEVIIPAPSAHIGKKPIHVKLLSSKRRIGMVGSARASGELLGPSDILLFHCHGGGFVAQSTRSHEIYLRDWAIKLDVPLLSIDYSLAPEAPFPRALEEVVYAYAWAIKHANSLLGTTANKILFIGDSAGANLLLGLTTKCFELNLRRPDGIFMAYVPVLVEFVPSPSKMLGLTDPLLSFGFMMRCLKAYTLGDVQLAAKDKEKDTEIESLKSDTDSFAEVSESDLIALALSPNGDEDEGKLASLPSDSTLNSVILSEAEGITGEEPINNETTSQQYVRKFLELYKSATARRNKGEINGEQQRDCSASEEKSSSFLGINYGTAGRELDSIDARSPVEEFVFQVPRDPLLSPYRLPDEILSQFPPIKILSTDLDPCLDDCVMFARKLKVLGNDIHLDILSGLPHGFLSLCWLSKEAHEGSEMCVKRIKELIST